jgi:thioesterase domain-containing protein
MSQAGAIAFLPGAGGGVPDLEVFRDGSSDRHQVEVIAYPGWRRYIVEGYSANDLIDDLAAEIARRVPQGPIRIVGVSIGGHFGYAVGLRLQSWGREIAGLCAIDSMMIQSSGPSKGWKKRALQQALELVRGRSLSGLTHFMRSKFWRALMRALGGRLTAVARRHSTRLPLVFALDPLLEEELNMRLLIRTSASWFGSLDCNPITLTAPTVLLRTKLVAGDEESWRRRCPNIGVFEISGKHHNLFDAENVAELHEVFVGATRDWRR